MSAAVAADSLSSLTTLSSNPPKYPRNPALESRNPLVLYIARVPGSKDVFLTTIKPRQKTVTAEDVTCSLYYMHVDQLENDVLYDATGGTGEQFQDGRERSSTELNRVERKPLPPNPQLLQPQVRPGSLTKDRPDYRHPAPDYNRNAPLSRKPVSSSGGNISQSDTGLQRRPLGPRLIGSEYQPVNQPPGLENVPPNRRTERRPALPPRSGLSAPPGDISLSRGRSESPTKRPGISASGNDRSKTSSVSNLPPPGPGRSLDVPAYPRRPSLDIVSPEDISITIIRRDPASSNQWNVGKITITSAPDGHSAPRQQPRSSSHAKAGGVHRRILIEITNPGYTKFLPPKRLPFYPPPDSEGRIPLSEDQESIRWKDFAYQNGMSSRPPEERDTDIDDEVFRREVWAEGVGFWDRNLRRMSGNGTANFPANNTTLPTSRASPSYGGTVSTGLRGNETGESSAKPMAKGDVFISPWDGRCEFSTGAGGRSLKCKHTLPVGDISARQVSELRFNLPTSSTFSNGSSIEMKKSLNFAKNIRKHFHPSHRHYDSESVSAASSAQSGDNNGDKRPGLDRRLSIALGQEKAGGGSGGKRSKLGKLIVESEGQMMLDLIVAVNMGIWWRAWEKIDGNALAGELD